MSFISAAACQTKELCLARVGVPMHRKAALQVAVSVRRSEARPAGAFQDH